MYAALNGFWLKENKPGGINGNDKYAKGSYYYMKESAIKKSALDAMSLFDNKKTDPNEMVEDSYNGIVFSFDSASAAVMKCTDDDPGKHNDLDGALLANLNKMAEEKSTRHYRKWIVNGTNGDYPVLSNEYFAIPVTEERLTLLPIPDAETAKKIAGVYFGEHHHWTSQV